MKKLIVLALLAGAMLVAAPHMAAAQSCDWNSSYYNGLCSGYGPGQNCNCILNR